jgi:predicted nucleic acid-binding protein
VCELALSALFGLPLTVTPLGSDLTGLSIVLARMHGVSFYDACYLALATQLDCPLITADQRLERRTRATGRVRLLGK